MPNHFGLKILEGKYGFKLQRENYAKISKKSSFTIIMKSCDYEDKREKLYTNEWCEKHQKNCLENYDLNMQYLSLLNRDEFNEELNKFLKSNECFVEVFDLNQYDSKPGYYIMVFDEYKQIYIGTTQDIKKRIRQHWNKNKSFDRILCPIGAIDTSIISVDSFRPLDNTRIFGYVTKETFDREDEFIKGFPAKFMTNRMAGGRVTEGLFQAIKMV
ncbi:MAG: GIY-YIG nuclease family protein, partial [Clostridium sp.]